MAIVINHFGITGGQSFTTILVFQPLAAGLNLELCFCREHVGLPFVEPRYPFFGGKTRDIHLCVPHTTAKVRTFRSSQPGISSIAIREQTVKACCAWAIVIYCGWTKSCTSLNPCKTIVAGKLQEDDPPMVS